MAIYFPLRANRVVGFKEGHFLLFPLCLYGRYFQVRAWKDGRVNYFLVYGVFEGCHGPSIYRYCFVGNFFLGVLGLVLAFHGRNGH